MQCLKTFFPRLSQAKVKEGVFVGPRIRKLLIDDDLVEHLTADQAAAWNSFNAVVDGFLQGHTSDTGRYKVICRLGMRRRVSFTAQIVRW